MTRRKRFAIALDVMLSVFIGGPPGVCVSSRAVIEKDNAQRWMSLYVLLNWIAPDHCEESVMGDTERACEALRYLVKMPVRV
jgi:hypothetical protein